MLRTDPKTAAGGPRGPARERRRALTAAAAALVLASATFAAPADVARAGSGESFLVVTTTEGLASLVRAVAGSSVSVAALAHGHDDPHFVDAKPTLALALSKAKLLVHVGLDLESGWLPSLLLTARNPAIQPGATGNLEASAFVAVADVPTVDPAELRRMGDLHPRGNPHFLTSPVEARKVAAAIAARLSVLDPGGAARYDAGLRAFAARLDAKEKEWRGALAAVAGRPVVAYHQSWNYFLRWAGLTLVGYVEPRPGIPPSPSHLAALVAAMKAKGSHAVIVESWYPTKTAEVVAKNAGARLLVLPGDVLAEPALVDYFAFMDRLVAMVVKGAP